MRHKLTGSLNFPRPPQIRVIGKPRSRIAEKLIHTSRRSRIVDR